MKFFFSSCSVLSVYISAFEGQEVYEKLISSISNIHSPSVLDFEKMQEYLLSERPYLYPIDLFYDFQRRSCRQMKIYDQNIPSREVFLRSNKKNSKKRAIITYCSLNGPYGLYVNEIAERLSKYNRSYDFYGMIGSYPATQEDGMSLFHIPYAWKVCLFKKMKQQGYEQLIWIDSSMMPIKNPEELFSILDQKKRFFIPAIGKYIGEFYRPYFNMYENAFKACGLEPCELLKMRHYQATVIGLDLSDSISFKYLQEWYELTKNIEASCTTLPEELIMTTIGHKMGLDNDILDSNLFTYSMDWSEGCYFLQYTKR
jgi:hypothetical protein